VEHTKEVFSYLEKEIKVALKEEMTAKKE